MDVIECDTARQFLDELDPSNSRWTKSNAWRNLWIYRGQADADWPLIPSIQRASSLEKINLVLNHETVEGFINRLGNTKNDPYNLKLLILNLYAEVMNIREFLELANDVGLSSYLMLPKDFPIFGDRFLRDYIENIEDSDYIKRLWGNDSIAIAQHNSLNTRLLDWTRDAIYAAFFASEKVEPNATHISVHALNGYSLSKSDIELVEIRRTVNPYILAQKGVFTLDKKAESVFLQTGKWRGLPDNEGEMVKVKLPVSEVKELQRILWLKNVTRAHMMPSLENVVLSLFHKRLLRSQ